jgi:hypothetical protein
MNAHIDVEDERLTKSTNKTTIPGSSKEIMPILPTSAIINDVVKQEPNTGTVKKDAVPAPPGATNIPIEEPTTITSNPSKYNSIDKNEQSNIIHIYSSHLCSASSLCLQVS